MVLRFRTTPIAGLIVVCPRVEINSVERYSLDTDRDFNEIGPHLGIEPVAVHAEITGRIDAADEAGQDGGAGHRHSAVALATRGK